MELRILSCSWFQPFFHTIYFCCCLAFSFGWPDFVFISDSFYRFPRPRGRWWLLAWKLFYVLLCFFGFRYGSSADCRLDLWSILGDFAILLIFFFSCCCGLAHNTFLYLPASRKYSHSIKNLIEQQFPIDILLFFVLLLFRCFVWLRLTKELCIVLYVAHRQKEVDGVVGYSFYLLFRFRFEWPSLLLWTISYMFLFILLARFVAVAFWCLFAWLVDLGK